MTPDQRAAAERIIRALQNLGNEEEEAAMLLAELLATTVGACRCGDRPAAACPGEWEPGCDLGANAKYARAVDPGPAVQALTTEPMRCPTNAERYRSLLTEARRWWRPHATDPTIAEIYDTDGADVLSWMTCVDEAMKETP